MNNSIFQIKTKIKRLAKQVEQVKNTVLREWKIK
jgi:hypothetical protein